MEKEVKLKPKKHSPKTKRSIFASKKKRYIVLFLCVLPLLIAIGVFSFFTYREVKNLLELAKGDESTTIRDEYIVTTMNYRLRDNATDYQKEIFKELKDTLENPEGYDDQTAVELVAKNYIADFYTFSNKAGQYDVGGMYYWYSEKDEKSNAYLAVRDGFYKYINYYMNQYGAENLIEVEDVQVTKCVKEANPLTLSVHWTYEQDENGEWYDVKKDYEYDTYNVTCTWTYKEGYQPSSTKFPTSVNMLILNRGKFEIVCTSEKPIDVREVQKQTNKEQVKEEVTDGIETEETD